MNKIVSAFEVSLFDPVLSEASIEMAELGIDSLLDEGLLKSIPIVNLLIGMGKTAQNIHDRNLLRQTVKFINAFNDKSVSLQKINKYRDRLRENSVFAENELGRVIILLNSTTDLKKSEILARLYRAYINGDFDWDMFCELSDVNSRLFLSDLELLLSVYNKEITDTTGLLIYQSERLVSLGLLHSTVRSVFVSNNSNSRTDKFLQTSSLGIVYCKFGILG